MVLLLRSVVTSIWPSHAFRAAPTDLWAPSRSLYRWISTQGDSVWGGCEPTTQTNKHAVRLLDALTTFPLGSPVYLCLTGLPEMLVPILVDLQLLPFEDIDLGSLETESSANEGECCFDPEQNSFPCLSRGRW
jgi:hypothetical protein